MKTLSTKLRWLLYFSAVGPFSSNFADVGLVVGSFADRDNALRQLGVLQKKVNPAAFIAEFSDENRDLFRLVIPTTDSDLRTVRLRAQKAGFGQGWRLDYQPPQMPSARRDEGIGLIARDQESRTRASIPEKSEQGPIGLVRLGSDGEEINIELPRLDIGEATIELDGRLDESIWASIPGYDNMLVMDPDTLEKTRFKTDARMFYTEKGLYVGVFMEQPSETLIARLSSRDEFINRDSIGITIDTSGEGLYGYWFTLNLGGSVMDGKVAPERQFSREWDGPWESGTAVLDDGWSAEMFLPWSMMTMASSTGENRKLGFWLNRKVAFLDERWSWPALPFASPRFMSALATMRTPGVEPKQQIAVFPYASYTSDQMRYENEGRAGIDVSWRPTSNLQLTATLNPDFGAVESDDVVVNLTAFETFFPEKRLFFLEGREVFATTPRSQVRSSKASSGGSRQTTSTFNPEPTTLLNTRRIGGAPSVDTPMGVRVDSVDLTRPTDLKGALKVTGQNGSVRYGFLGAFEGDMRLPGVYSEPDLSDEKVNIDTFGRDFGVARFLYETVGEGRSSIGYLGTLVTHENREAAVHGLDGHWLSENGAWQIDGQLIQSDVDDEIGFGVMADVDFKPKQGTQHKLMLDYFDKRLDVSDLGFIRRNDVFSKNYQYNWSTGRGLTYFRSKKRSIMISNSWNMDGKLVRSGLFFRNGWTFKNLNEIRTEFNYFPARWEDRNSFGNGAYKMHDRFVGELAFGTDTSQQVSLSALVGMRQEELSDWTLRSSVGVTYKPADQFSLDLDLNYFERTGWLLHNTDRLMSKYDAGDFQPRLGMDIFFTAKQQLRLTVQWAVIKAEVTEFLVIPEQGGTLVSLKDSNGYIPTNSVREDFALSRLTSQIRYRWEIGPLSDFFLVYTRGSNLPNRVEESYGELWEDAISYPIVDTYVAKLRYRFGN